jgi:IrrE N-terminal-like domain
LKYIPDKTGRFRQRPHYLPGELDDECESTITQFTREICGDFLLPIPTDVLTKLIERDAGSLDLYSDLSQEEGTNVEGVTDFIPGGKPIVRIAASLSEAENRSHRLRTTLTHEYGHVKFHNYLYQVDEGMGVLFSDAFERRPAKCKRETMLDAPASDWMEWQAGYVCGSILMPLTHVKKVVGNFRKTANMLGPIAPTSKEGMMLLAKMEEDFGVSQEAARIRLLKLGLFGSDKTHNLPF